MSIGLTAAIDTAARAGTTRLMRAVGYARVSTDEQAKGYSIQAARKKIVRYCDRRDMEMVDFFKDEGVSGSLPWQLRDDLPRMMKLARREPRPFDFVVVPETRAIGRKDRVFYRWVWELQDLGIHVAVVDKDFDTSTEAGQDRLREEFNYAAKEYTRIRVRTQDGIQEKAEEGGHVGGIPSYGYRIENQGKRRESRLVIDDEEAAVLRSAWRLLVVTGLTVSEVAWDLNLEESYRRDGDPWTAKSLRYALTAPAVQRGERRFRQDRTPQADAEGNPYPPIVIKLDPIFSEEEVVRLNAALARTSRPTRAEPTFHPLSERVFGLCGKHYTGTSRANRDQHVYRCTGKNTNYYGGKKRQKCEKCECPQIDGQALESRVWTEVCKLLSDPERVAAMAADWAEAAQSGHVDHKARINSLAEQIEDTEETITITMGSAAKQARRRGLKGREAEAAVERALKSLNEELASLEAQKAEAEAWQQDTLVAAQRGRDLQELARVARKRLHDMTKAQQAEVLALLDARVTILGDVPRRLRKDDGISAWFRERGRTVPRMTDEAWARLEPALAAWRITVRRPGRKLADPRRIITGMLEKARTGRPWVEINREYGNTLSVWQRWLQNGLWEQLMDAVADLPGDTLRDLVILPPLRVEGRIDPRLFIEEDKTLEEGNLKTSSLRPM
jgi:DNA invertase Pin-like site-specific DNA recombinase/transposase